MNAVLNFEKTRKNAPRHNDAEMEAIRARKGKHNKQGRTSAIRTQWESI